MYKAILTNLPKILFKIARKFREKNSKNNKRTVSYWKNCICFKKFFRARSMQFWQPCLNFPQKVQKLENRFTIIFFSQRSCFSPPKSSGKMECKFDCLLNECLSNLWRHVSQSGKTFTKKNLIKLKRLLPEKCFWACIIKVLQSCRFFSKTLFLSKGRKQKEK